MVKKLEAMKGVFIGIKILLFEFIGTLGVLLVYIAVQVAFSNGKTDRLRQDYHKKISELHKERIL